MEPLQKLEERMFFLVDAVKKLKEDNVRLVQEKNQLEEKLIELELVAFDGAKRLEELDLEHEKTKSIVDSLIKSIDDIVEGEIQP